MAQHRRPTARPRPALALAATAVAGVTLLGASAPALAAKGSGGGRPAPSTSATMRLVPLDSTDGTVHHGQRITFEVQQSATDRPFVGVRCWQGDAWVLDGYIGLFPDTMDDQWEIMDSTYWQAGRDAACTARLFWYDRRGNEKQLSSMQFSVAP